MSSLKARDIKAGMTFYECEYGQNLKFEAVDDAICSEGNIGVQWRWQGIDEKGKVTEFLITEGYEHYGPRIYSEPAYI